MEMKDLVKKYNALVEELQKIQLKEHGKKREIQIVLQDIRKLKEKNL